MSARTAPVSRIAIVGVGQVGGAVAYALILGSVASELLLVDVKADLRDCQVRDLSDVVYSHNSSTRVRSATYDEAGQCDIVVVTAGSKYSPGETSMQHMYRNIGILRNAVTGMKPFSPSTILIVVANPVDLLSSLALELSGLPPSQVIGSGTFLDSVRLRGLVADKIGIAPSSIDLYVLGMHGERQVAAWSTATVDGFSIDKAVPAESLNRNALADECKHKSQSIFRVKGATPYGIGAVVLSLCSSILLDKHEVRPVSHFQPEFGCFFSLPVILGRGGIISTIALPLAVDERAKIADSAEVLRDTLARIRENQ
ncbi:lactate/malate dehydrogenase family protein [Aspergillus mulundensis]|uniref:L-lactate dehydrogenase n=1 Tax=Aspergillus mulundensis TaxID=1810919 RepID=A0A3D8T5M8_9EURO|nr:Uncharacterized protein DSM5745_01161 [Aspergillus mulundensis]RDW93839.1 Uncharacterized protein DSM5745_01161 [Aspergillus mulundensis]